MPSEICDNVYDITCLQQAGRRIRVYLFDHPTPTLVDAGLPDTTAELIAGIEATGVSPERLILTHADPDHIGGFDAVVDRFGLETWVPEGASYDVDTAPEHRYGDGDRIGQFATVHLPGHGPHHYGLIDESAGVAVLGDALSGADQRGLPAGYFHLPPGVYSEDLNQAEASLERLLEYDFDVGLVFHGSSVTADARDVLDRYVNFPGKPS